MTNDMICNILGVLGMIITFIGGGCFFFGASFGLYMAIAGLLMTALGLANYEK